MKKVLDDATKMVNSRMFQNLDIQHINLLHTEIRWPTRGRVLIRVFELKGELQDYFKENTGPDFSKCFEDEEWLEKLAYLAHIFHHMNQLNNSLQGPGENVLTSRDKILGFERKLNL
jgi:hypothetical protein